MSLFGSMLGDFEEDPIFGHMNSVMGSFFGGDPFGGLLGGMGMQPFGRMNNALTHHNSLMAHQNAMMPFGFPAMPRFNPMPMQGSSSFTSTSYVSMSSGPDGRPQIYQASSSTKTGPNGVMETKKTVQDSRTGVKKMAIGHHIYDRGHIIEREQNLRDGTEEERQDFINLEEEEAEEFNREFLSKAGSRHSNGGPSIQCIETGPLNRNSMPAIMPATATGNSRKRPIEVVEDDDDETAEPIIELPESPSPPTRVVEDAEEDEHNAQEEEDGTDRSSRVDIEEVRTGGSNNSSNGTPRERTNNPLGVQPRKPIRTHQASPLATNSAGHSRRSGGNAHPYNMQPNRKAHRPMKGTVQQHHNNPYHQNPPQYERDNN